MGHAYVDVMLLASFNVHVSQLGGFMKNAVFRDVRPCGPWKNQRFGGNYRLRHQGEKLSELAITLTITSKFLPIVAANVS
jgi:hypothetical protein